MMDADTDIHSGKVGIADQNGVQYDHYVSRDDDIAVEVNGSPDSTLVGVGPDCESNGNGIVNPSNLEDVHVGNSVSPASEVHCFPQGYFYMYLSGNQLN